MERSPLIPNGRDNKGRFSNKFGEDFTRHIGKPAVWKTPEDMLDSFQEYVLWSEDNPIIEIEYNGSKAIRCEIPKARPLTQVGFCAYCKTARGTFYYYQKNEEYKDAIAFISDVFTAHNIDYAACGLLNASIIARLEGLVDKKEIRTENVQTVFFEVPVQQQIQQGIDELKEGEDWELI